MKFLKIQFEKNNPQVVNLISITARGGNPIEVVLGTGSVQGFCTNYTGFGHNYVEAKDGKLIATIQGTEYVLAVLSDFNPEYTYVITPKNRNLDEILEHLGFSKQNSQLVVKDNPVFGVYRLSA